MTEALDKDLIEGRRVTPACGNPYGFPRSIETGHPLILSRRDGLYDGLVAVFLKGAELWCSLELRDLAFIEGQGLASDKGEF